MLSPLTRPRASSRALSGALVGIVVAAGLVLVGGSPAAADPPTNLTPDGTNESGIPVLSWDRSSPTAKYDIEISVSDTFTPVFDSVNATANSQWVPDKQLPTGDLFWRVRVDGTSEAWATATFERDDVAAPTVTSPADGQQLEQPGSPPVLSWEAVPGADSYEVEYGTDESFVDQTTEDGTESTSYVVGLQGAGEYFWRVRAVLAAGIYTEWSDGHSYEVEALPSAALVSPASAPTTNIEDVVLDWEPVPGAKSYDLQVSTDQNFNDTNATVVDDDGILGTRWSRGTTLNNDQYYWRVRPVDADSHRPEWGEVPVWQFRRNWPEQPELEYPADEDVVGDPFYYQWEPVELASKYTVQVSENASFTPAAQVETCTTVHTTLAMGDLSRDADCFPAALGHYYWRVFATDEFASPAPVTEVVNGEVFEFDYVPSGVTHVSPAPGATVKVPTLRWNPVAGAAQYRVTVTAVSSGDATTKDTAATSFTPRALEPGAYRWDVRTLSEDGREGWGLTLGSQPIFTVEDFVGGDPASAAPDGHDLGSSYRFPTLTWDRVAAAEYYRLRLKKSTSIGWTALPDTYEFPAGEDFGTDWLAAGDYDYYVDAFNSANSLIASGSAGSFTIDELPIVPLDSYEAALTGDTLTGNGGVTDVCDATLPASCQNMRQTPALGWGVPDPNTGYYQLRISRDAALTNIVKTVDVASTMWIDIVALADSQAGSAYFWVLVPCTADGNCRKLHSADHAFNKLSRPVTLVSPANGATVQDDVTFTWDDYLVSQAVVDGVGDPDTGTPLDTPARTEARQYRIQTSTDPNMAAPVTTTSVDQLTFTSLNDTYPEGTNYWRVQAVDGSGNQLAWSEIRSFVKQSPAPTLSLPAAGQEVPGDSTLSWEALAFAASYVVEVYKNNDMVPSLANRVVNESTKRVSLVLDSLDPNLGPYTWRVRRDDAEGRDGAWSALRQFIVSKPAPALVAPADAAQVEPSDGRFAWGALAGATKYRFERRVAGASSSTETVTTPALAYAPVAAIAGGNHAWRVTALDTAGHALGSSAWRPFSVVDTPSAVAPVTITGSGAYDTPLTLTEPVWDMPNVTTTYQWYRGTSAISGQTGTTYNIVTADIGKAITVRATGTRPGYKAATSTSNAITGVAGPALVPIEPPSFSGIPAVRETLTASPGTWPGNPSFTYQWFVDGLVVAKADDQEFVVRAHDAGLPIKVRVIATTAGYQPGTAFSAARTVAKLPSTTTATLQSKTITKRARGVLTVTIRVRDLGSPLGDIQVREGAKQLARVRLGNDGGGKVTIRLRKLLPGKHRLTVTYLGSVATKASSAKTLTLKVTRKRRN